MRNRILAIFLILIICVSMIPINVYAASTQELALVKQEMPENGYNIKYFAPEGYSDVFILKQSDTQFQLYYVESGGKYLCNTSGYGKLTKSCARIFDIKSLNEVYEILFLGKYNSYSFNVVNAGENIHGTTNQIYVSISLDSLGSVNTQQQINNSIRDDYMKFAEFYSEWYFSVNGIPPQPDLEDSKYMIGDYYFIAKQPIISQGGGTSFGGETMKRNGYVETVENATVYSDDGLFTYVVVSTERTSGELLRFGGTFWEIVFDTFVDNLKFILGESRAQKIIDIVEKETTFEKGTNRNGYALADNSDNPHQAILHDFFYSEDEYINRYYFSNLNDASKFVLYGTVGATPDYIEEGKTHYGYGYLDIVYNNYELDGYPKNEIPNFSYPLGQAQFILREHEENVYEREYVLITMDYYPFAAVVTQEYKFNIPNSVVNAKYKNAFQVDGDENFKFKDLTQYESTDKYNAQGIQHFQLYYPELEEQYVSSSWDLVYWTVPLKHFKHTYDEDGNLVIQSGSILENDFLFQIKENEDGSNVYVDNLNNKRFDENGNEYYDEDGNGEYTDKNGNTIDDSKLKDPNEDYYKSLTERTSTLQNISLLLEEFIKLIEYAEDETKPLVDLLNAFMKNLPTVFRTIIGFVILAMILRRIFKSN